MTFLRLLACLLFLLLAHPSKAQEAAPITSFTGYVERICVKPAPGDLPIPAKFALITAEDPKEVLLTLPNKIAGQDHLLEALLSGMVIESTKVTIVGKLLRIGDKEVLTVSQIEIMIEEDPEIKFKHKLVLVFD